jgi:hypothetical protein
MSHISVKEALEKVFTGSENPAEVFKQVRNEDIVDLEIALRKMCTKVYKGELEKKGQEVVDWSSRGQWKIEKATKQNPTLDYGKIDPERNPLSNPQAAKEAKAKRYAEIEANAPTIDYQNNRTAQPKYYKGAADKAAQVRAKLEVESKETALDTFRRRGQMKPSKPETPLAPSHPATKQTKKSEGVNVEEEPSSAERAKMTAKSEMPGVPTMASSAVAMSEKEPHMDDPKHEEKEKKKAKKIKDEAEDLLDMHKVRG